MLSQSCFYSFTRSAETAGGAIICSVGEKKAELPTDWLTGTSVVIGFRLWREHLEEAQGGISSGRFSFSRAPFVADSRVHALAVLSQTLATYCSKKSLHNYIILKLPRRIPVSLSPNSSKWISAARTRRLRFVFLCAIHCRCESTNALCVESCVFMTIFFLVLLQIRGNISEVLAKYSCDLQVFLLNIRCSSRWI